MRILFCGSRNYCDDDTILEAMVQHANPGDVIVHGCANGADTIANDCAEGMGLAIDRFPAQWKTYGKGAGPIRNKEMLSSGIDLVIAFGDGRGTGHMCKIAEDAGIKVIRYDYEVGEGG